MGTPVFSSAYTRFVSLDLKNALRCSIPLAALGGNTAPTSESIVKILSSVGIEAESDKLDKVIAELSGKGLKALIAEGHTKLASMPAGGSAAPAAAGPAAASAAAVPAEAKKEEKEESEEEEDDDMGFGLFD